MKAIEVFRKIRREWQAHLVRPSKKVPGEYDVKTTGSRKGWVLVDATTASAVCQVWDALNETNRTKFESLDLFKMVDVTWKLVK